MSHKICLITGATSGIGKAAAIALARMGCDMVLLGRDEEKLRRACSVVRGGSSGAKVDTYACDLSLMQDVRATIERIKAERDRIDILINNAGARFVRHQLTPEGLEMTLATNHLGHFLLAVSLVDQLKRSVQGRVINVSSGVHHHGTGVIENVLSKRFYNGQEQYANSMLANVLFTYALAERLKGLRVTVNAVNPGIVATNFARNNGLIPWLKHRIYHFYKGQLLTPREGAQPVVYLASSDAVSDVTGQYFEAGRASASSAFSYRQAAQQRLWEVSASLTGIDL
jgi:NAD(P)-dependent dehydrogenase (short-subunit alcohol dehydrogenase family)